ISGRSAGSARPTRSGTARCCASRGSFGPRIAEFLGFFDRHAVVSGRHGVGSAAEAAASLCVARRASETGTARRGASRHAATTTAGLFGGLADLAAVAPLQLQQLDRDDAGVKPRGALAAA